MEESWNSFTGRTGLSKHLGNDFVEFLKTSRNNVTHCKSDTRGSKKHQKSMTIWSKRLCWSKKCATSLRVRLRSSKMALERPFGRLLARFWKPLARFLDPLGRPLAHPWTRPIRKLREVRIPPSPRHPSILSENRVPVEAARQN